MVNFEELKNKFDWNPIYGCPGRFILKNSGKFKKIEELLYETAGLNSFHVPGSDDEIFIVKVDGGGLISYKKKDGYFIHTLNDNEGFLRKLALLGIDPELIK